MIACVNCQQPIEWVNVVGSSGFWVHPDLADYDTHGSMCDDDEEQAEPPAEERK